MTESAREITRRQFSRWLVGLAVGGVFARHSFGQTSGRVLLCAVSIDTLAGANVNDARAAYRVWIREITNTLGATSVAAVPDIFVPSEQIVQMIRRGEIDLFGITAWEYAKVVDFVDATSLLVEESMADGMEYVLLVHNASPFKKLSDLHGGHLATHAHRDMNLMPAWIGNLLANDNLPRMDLFFADQVARSSVTQVVLPVFFRRMDAACLSRRYFDIAVELNPQLGKDLHALAISPKVVPITLCFHKNCSPASVAILKSSIARSAALPAGQQINALYQTRTFISRPSSCMNGTLEMLHQYARVVARTPGLRKDNL
jgi:ABC-type phosphate/phosphonate transport system substrate-binding protein